MKQELKARAHSLKPVVLLGNKGLTDAVMQEIDLALNAHELIKVKLRGQDKEARANLVKLICQTLNAECIQCIGLVAVLYREQS